MPEALIDCVGWALLHFLWQGLLSGVLAAVVLVAMRRCSASARYVAAVTALFALAALPVATVIWLANGTQAEAPLPVAPHVTQATPETRVAPVIDEQPEAEPAMARDSDAMAMNDVPPLPMDGGIATAVRDEPAVFERRVAVSPWESVKAFCAARLNWIVNGWLVGVAFLSLRMLVGWGRVQRLKRLAQQPASEALQGLLARLIERLKVSRPVRLVESALVEVPTVIGWLKPVILLPATALSGLSTSQLEALLAHELAHVRRNDFLFNLLQSVVETLLFYHPVVWWLSRRIRIEREHCCDDLAVQVCGDELSYAKALVALEELRGPQLKLAMSADGGSLLGRVARLLGAKERTTAAPSVGSVALSLVVIAMLALATADGGWALLPVRSESDATPNQSEESQDIEAEQEVTNEVTADAANNDQEGRAGVPDLRSLVDAIADSSKKLATGRMQVEWEKVTDQSWISAKKDEGSAKTVGKMTWRDDGKQWRVDFDGELPNSGAGGKVTNSLDLWSTGFDGERFYNFDRDAKSLVIGELHQSARVYEPANLFWNPTSGGVESVLEVLRKPEVTVSKAMIDGLEGYRVERIVEREGKWRWSAFVCPSRSYLALEIQQFFKEQLSWECKLSDLAEVQPGVWYPQKIRRTSFNVGANGQSSVAWQNDYSVTEFELGIEAAGKNFSPRPGGHHDSGRGRGVGGEGTNGLSGAGANTNSKEPLTPGPSPRSTGARGVGTLAVPYGIHINDLTRGSAYFNDPWWSELEPILKQKHAWPKTSLLPLENVKSQFEKAPTTTFRFLNGAALPKFETKDGNSLVWTAGPEKKQPQAKVTLVLFWAPWEERSVKALVAAKRLHDELSPHGLQIVAVQDSHQAAKTPAAFLKSLALPFPTILDEFPEVEGDLGKDTIRKTFGVRGMPTGCLLDQEHRVIAITDQKKLTVQVAELLKAARQSLDPLRSQAEPGNELPILKMDEPLSDEIGRAAEAEWKELVAKAEPRTHIKGRVVTEKNVPMAAVVVEVRPQLKLARGGYGGLTVYPDFKATKTFRTNAGGVFDAQSLPKGSYEVRVKAGGYARRTFDVAVGPGQPGELGDIVLDQRDAISGFVVDGNGKVLVGAKVEALWRHTDPKNVAIKTRSPRAMPKTTVRGDGSFFLQELEVGRYTLEFNADGHEREVREAVSLGGLFGKVWLDAYPEPLQRKVSLKLQEALLPELLKQLCEQAKVELAFDAEGLKQAGLTQDTPVMFEVSDKTLGDALEVLLARAEEDGSLGFAWDGKRLFVSTREIAKKHRLPPLETVKGAPRERYAQKALEVSIQELEIAQKANLRVPGSVPESEVKKLQVRAAAARAEYELVLHDASQVIGQPITSEFKLKSNELLLKRVEAFVEYNKVELEIALQTNRRVPGSVPESEIKRLQQRLVAARVEHELVLHQASQVLGQPITTEFKKKSDELLVKRVAAFLEINKLELEIADEANKQKPGSVKDEELQRLRGQIQSLEADLARLTGKPMAKAPVMESQTDLFAGSLVPLAPLPIGAKGAGLASIAPTLVKRADEIGVVRGQITLKGAVPQAAPHAVYDRVNAFLPWRLKAPTDKQIADYEADRAKHPAKYEPRKVRDESLLVSPRGELANAVVYLEKAPQDWKPAPIANASQTLKAEADRFAPHVVLLRLGQSLKLAQADAPRVDNFHWQPVRNAPFNIMVEKEKPFVVEPKVLRFPEKIPTQVRSDINSWKTAYVLLLDHPFMAVTDAEGRFEIPDLPPGTHQFKVWHERTGYLDKKLEVTVSDQPLEPLALSYPSARVISRPDSFLQDALNRSELALSATWLDASNEFAIKPGQRTLGIIQLHLKNTSDKPVTVGVPSAPWRQRREVKVRDLKIRLEPALDAKSMQITIPAHDVISLTQCEVQVDFTGLDAGYWQLQLQTPLHAVPCYLTFWLDGPATVVP